MPAGVGGMGGDRQCSEARSNKPTLTQHPVSPHPVNPGRIPL